jgi:hypothetical protein
LVGIIIRIRIRKRKQTNPSRIKTAPVRSTAAVIIIISILHYEFAGLALVESLKVETKFMSNIYE